MKSLKPSPDSLNELRELVNDYRNNGGNVQSNIDAQGEYGSLIVAFTNRIANLEQMVQTLQGL